MNDLRVLVTGAAGKAGLPVVKMMSEKGIAVRVFVKQ
jgi:nucleoside-diphosphate-sugar epimerase